MFCEEMGLLLSKYVDDELSEFERKKVEEHIIVCVGCRDTLAIFLRNENIIASAFSGESFGEKVANEVLTRIKGRKSKLVKAKIIAIDLISRLRQKISMPVAVPIAAGVIFVFVFLGLIWSLEGKLATLSDALLRNKILTEAVAKMSPAVNKDKDLFSANIDKDQFEIRGTFISQKANVVSFNLERKILGINQPPETIATGLKEARFRDASALAGTSYEYKFIAMGSDGTTQASLPVYVTTKPDELSNIPDYTEIQFLKAEGENILVSVSKTLDGVTFSELFVAKKSQEIGAETYSAEAQKKVDFSTGFQVESIEDADDSIIITVASNKVDSKTSLPIYNVQTGKPETEYQSFIITRPSRKVVLVDNKGGKLNVFQGRSIKIPQVK